MGSNIYEEWKSRRKNTRVAGGSARRAGNSARLRARHARASESPQEAEPLVTGTDIVSHDTLPVCDQQIADQNPTSPPLFNPFPTLTLESTRALPLHRDLTFEGVTAPYHNWPCGVNHNQAVDPWSAPKVGQDEQSIHASTPSSWSEPEGSQDHFGAGDFYIPPNSSIEPNGEEGTSYHLYTPHYGRGSSSALLGQPSSSLAARSASNPDSQILSVNTGYLTAYDAAMQGSSHAVLDYQRNRRSQ